MAINFSFNPFGRLFESKRYPHARARRTSFGQKCRDTFALLFGQIPFTRYHSAGLLDYALLPLSIISYLFIGLAEKANHPAARGFFGLIGAIFALPKLIIASALTFAFLTFIGIAHGISQIKGRKLKNIIKDSDVTLTDSANKTTIVKMRAYLKEKSKQVRTHLSLNSDKNFAVLNEAGTGFTVYFNHRIDELKDDEKNTATGEVIRAKGTKIHAGSAALTYSLKDTKASEIDAMKKTMKAYRKLNIGHVQEAFEVREEQEAKKTLSK